MVKISPDGGAVAICTSNPDRFSGPFSYTFLLEFLRRSGCTDNLLAHTNTFTWIRAALRPNSTTKWSSLIFDHSIIFIPRRNSSQRMVKISDLVGSEPYR